MFVDDCRLFMCFAPLLHSLPILEEKKTQRGGKKKKSIPLVNSLISPTIDSDAFVTVTAD